MCKVQSSSIRNYMFRRADMGRLGGSVGWLLALVMILGVLGLCPTLGSLFRGEPAFSLFPPLCLQEAEPGWKVLQKSGLQLRGITFGGRVSFHRMLIAASFSHFFVYSLFFSVFSTVANKLASFLPPSLPHLLSSHFSPFLPYFLSLRMKSVNT